VVVNVQVAAATKREMVPQTQVVERHPWAAIQALGMTTVLEATVVLEATAILEAAGRLLNRLVDRTRTAEAGG
jgi:hypothetical protein